MQRPLLAGLILTLTACGSGGREDFSLDVKRAPGVVSASLGSIRLDDAAVAAFSDMKLQVDKSAENEIVYTIPMSSSPGSADDSATVRFKLEPVGGGTATVVHVFVNVPPIRMLMGEANKELSEAKVEGELKKALAVWAKDMAMPTSDRVGTSAFSDLFAAVAVAGNFNFQSQVNAAKLGFVPRGRSLADSAGSTVTNATIDRDEDSRLDDPADSEEPISPSDAYETQTEADAERSSPSE